jgi:tRNA-specific 2-thiouridylase
MSGRFVGIDDLKNTNPSVLIAMSGGVDSAVAALLVRDAGLRVIGLTMKNYCYGDTEVPDRSCCSVEAIADARRECDRLGIPHRVADVEAFFTREVIDNFLSEYQNARTPNPCVRCNSIVRFQTLFDYAEQLGVDYVATGHYARIFEAPSGKRYLARSMNRAKDQSYFLSGVHGNALDRMLFPLGDYDKGQVRELAGTASMAVAGKKESQEVCFVPDGTLKSFLASREVPLRPGSIESVDGEVLGHHDGLAAYTVGQRRHLGIATGTPHYVVELDRERNVLVVGDADALLRRELSCRFAWLDSDVSRDRDGVTAQIRYRHDGAPVESIDVDGSRGRLVFVDAQRAICPGQTIALYRGDVVVGSGVIDDAGAA